MLESLEGKRGFPRIKPPYYPAAIGLYGAPTVVNNVETLSNLPWIMRNGSDAFSALGEGRSRGTKMLSPLRPRPPAGQLRGRVRQGDLPGAHLRRAARRRHQAGPRPQSVHPGRCFVSLVRSPAPGCLPGQRKDRRGRLHGGFGRHHGDGRHHVHRAGGLADHALLPPRVLRPVHPLSRGLGLGRKDHAPHRRRRGPGGRPGPAHGRVRQHLPGVSWPPAQTTICVLGPSIPSSVASGIRMFRDEFLDHIRLGHCPFPPDRLQKSPAYA